MSKRLPAAERRRALVEAALRVFVRGSYGSATTAEIAREAGVSEPILYRHFASKRELYVACLEHAWAELRAAIEERLAELGPADGPLAIGQTQLGLRAQRTLPPTLWLQAIVEAGDDAEIRRYLRRHIREVHGYFADVIRRSQAAGGVAPGRDPESEAWILLAGGLLVVFGDRLGGVLGHEDFSAIARARYTWLMGEEPPGELVPRAS